MKQTSPSLYFAGEIPVSGASTTSASIRSLGSNDQDVSSELLHHVSLPCVLRIKGKLRRDSILMFLAQHHAMVPPESFRNDNMDISLYAPYNRVRTIICKTIAILAVTECSINVVGLTLT